MLVQTSYCTVWVLLDYFKGQGKPILLESKNWCKSTWRTKWLQTLSSVCDGAQYDVLSLAVCLHTYKINTRCSCQICIQNGCSCGPHTLSSVTVSGQYKYRTSTSISTGQFLEDHWPCFLADESSCLNLGIPKQLQKLLHADSSAILQADGFLLYLYWPLIVTLLKVHWLSLISWSVYSSR